jgi:A/G-specific adenine glycosylase
MARRLKSSSRATGAQLSVSRFEALLDWYDRHRRLLPWRSLPGETPDPYRVWLSEIMLQQTTVAVVGPYFEAFMDRWPTLDALAAADLDDILHGWQGLGYYARARNLHRCAQVLVREHAGNFPTTEAALVKLPGIGAYTAAAIAAIAFDRPAVVVDGNVERVMARIYAVDDPLPGIKPQLKALAAGLTPSERAGDYAQAVMDLGAMICTPRRPKCAICPWLQQCAGKAHADTLPRRLPKKERPTRRAIAYWITNSGGEVLFRRRPESGLLGGMIEVPSSDWREAPMPSENFANKNAPSPLLEGRLLPGVVRHTFTHFHFEFHVVAGRASDKKPKEGFWCALEKLGDHALPSLMKKVVVHAMKHL